MRSRRDGVLNFEYGYGLTPEHIRQQRIYNGVMSAIVDSVRWSMRWDIPGHEKVLAGLRRSRNLKGFKHPFRRW